MSDPPRSRSGEQPRPYLAALRFHFLTRLYDPVVRLTTRERTFKERLLTQAHLEPGQSVLDLGCGTGTLALLAKRRQPQAELAGLDADPAMLDQARGKAGDAGVAVQLDQGFSTELPYPDDRFDRVLSSLFFHHLSSADKLATVTQVARVLRPGGELHVADWGQASDPLMAGLFWGVRLLDGLERTSANAAGELPALFEHGGLEQGRERDRLRTAFGTLSLYSARLRA